LREEETLQLDAALENYARSPTPQPGHPSGHDAARLRIIPLVSSVHIPSHTPGTWAGPFLLLAFIRLARAPRRGNRPIDRVPRLEIAGLPRNGSCRGYDLRLIEATSCRPRGLTRQGFCSFVPPEGICSFRLEGGLFSVARCHSSCPPCAPCWSGPNSRRRRCGDNRP
jgi:hypothetical protein